MIDISTVTDDDKDREIRYVSTSGHTVQLGKIAGVSGDYIMVLFHTQVKPKNSENKTMAGDPVACDPTNLEFV